MGDYIARDEAKNYIKNSDLSNQEKIACLCAINSISTESVAPVKHGKWRWNQNGMDWGLGAWECSECACRNNNLPMNKKINPLVFSGSKYCPNCGAKMDLEE